MHILFVSHSAELAGAEQSLLALVRQAHADGHRTTVFLPTTGPLEDLLKHEGSTVIRHRSYLWMGQRHKGLVGAVRLAQALAMVPTHLLAIRTLRPDVVVSNSIVVPTAALAAKLVGRRHVWLVQESFLTNPSLNSVLSKRMIARLIRRLSDQVVAVSDYVAGQLRDASRQRFPVHVIPPAVMDSELLRRKHDGVFADRPRQRLTRLLLLGTFSADKGQLEAIEAVRACRANGHELELLLLGTGTQASKERITRAITDAGLNPGEPHLHDHGGSSVSIEAWASDPSSAYRWADALLMLSRNEAFGRVTVEALAFGVPVVGYAAGATSEILAAGGGRLCAPGELVNVLQLLADDDTEYRRVAGEALKRAGALTDYADAAERFIQILEQP